MKKAHKLLASLLFASTLAVGLSVNVAAADTANLPVETAETTNPPVATNLRWSSIVDGEFSFEMRAITPEQAAELKEDPKSRYSQNRVIVDELDGDIETNVSWLAAIPSDEPMTVTRNLTNIYKFEGPGYYTFKVDDYSENGPVIKSPVYTYPMIARLHTWSAENPLELSFQIRPTEPELAGEDGTEDIVVTVYKDGEIFREFNAAKTSDTFRDITVDLKQIEGLIPISSKLNASEPA